MSTTYTDAESTNTLFEHLGDYAPESLSREEHDRIMADIASYRAGLADLDSEIACCSGSWRTWCIQVRDGMRRDLALAWAQLGEVR